MTSEEDIQLTDPAKREPNKPGKKGKAEVRAEPPALPPIIPIETPVSPLPSVFEVMGYKDEPESAPESLPEPPAPAPKRFQGKYRVLEDKLFTWNGYPTHLTRGGFVSANVYGNDGIERMKAWGVKLEEIEE